MSKTRAINRSRAVCRISLLVILAAQFFGHNAQAKPLAQFGTLRLSITLHDDDCTLKSDIVNLPKRAVWREGGVEIEGCWGVSEQFGTINFYFSDKTATSLPARLFGPITGV